MREEEQKKTELIRQIGGKHRPMLTTSQQEAAHLAKTPLTTQQENDHTREVSPHSNHHSNLEADQGITQEVHLDPPLDPHQYGA